MEDSDAQKTFEKYILDYMIKKNMHDSAAIFAKEANVCDDPVAYDSREGLLKDSWSVAWSIYSKKVPKHPEALEGSSSEVHSTAMPSPHMVDSQQSALSVAIPTPDTVNLPQSGRPTTTQRPEVNPINVGEGELSTIAGKH